MRWTWFGTRWITAFLLACMATAAASAERHEGKRVERAEISALEQQWRQAQLSEDVSGMDKLLSDEFLGITAAGQVVTKAQQLDRMRSRQIDLSGIEMTDTKIKISGSLAVVTSLAKLDGKMDGKPLRGYFRYTRVYQRVGRGDWKITNFEATRAPTGPGMYNAEFTAPRAVSPMPPAAVPSSPPASPAAPGSPKPRS